MLSIDNGVSIVYTFFFEKRCKKFFACGGPLLRRAFSLYAIDALCISTQTPKSSASLLLRMYNIIYKLLGYTRGLALSTLFISQYIILSKYIYI